MALVVALPLLGVCTFNYFKHKKEDEMIKEFDIFLKNLLQSLIAGPDSLSDEDYIEQMRRVMANMDLPREAKLKVYKRFSQKEFDFINNYIKV